MSHSTHVGFKAPRSSGGRPSMFTTPASFDLAATFAQSTFAPLSFQSLALGVGHVRLCRAVDDIAADVSWAGAEIEVSAAGVAPSLAAGVAPLLAAPQLAFGGSFGPTALTATARGVDPYRLRRARSASPVCRLRNDSGVSVRLNTPASGVGHNEDPVAPVRGADGLRWDTVPLSIEPARGQLSENRSHPVGSSKQRWNVLQQDDGPPWSNQANDAHEFPKEAGSGGFDSALFSCD